MHRYSENTSQLNDIETSDSSSIKDKIKFSRLSRSLHLSDFDCGDSDLNDFIANDAIKYQEHNLAQTTCILLEDKVVGFYSLRTDSLNVIDKKDKRNLPLPHTKRGYKTFPAISIARMAFDNKIKNKGLGSLVIKIVIGMVYSLNNEGAIGCRFITVDAYIGAIEFYKKNGFIFNVKADGDAISRGVYSCPTVSMRHNVYQDNQSAIQSPTTAPQ